MGILKFISRVINVHLWEIYLYYKLYTYIEKLFLSRDRI